MNVRKQQIGLKNTICSYLTEDDWLIFATHNTFKWWLFATYITLQIEWVKSGVTFQTRRVSPRLSKLMSWIDESRPLVLPFLKTKRFLKKQAFMIFNPCTSWQKPSLAINGTSSTLDYTKTLQQPELHIKMKTHWSSYTNKTWDKTRNRGIFIMRDIWSPDQYTRTAN